MLLISLWLLQSRMGGLFGLLLGFHKLYSRILLSAAVSKLGRLEP